MLQQWEVCFEDKLLKGHFQIIYQKEPHVQKGNDERRELYIPNFEPGTIGAREYPYPAGAVLAGV